MIDVEAAAYTWLVLVALAVVLAAYRWSNRYFWAGVVAMLAIMAAIFTTVYALRVVLS